MCEKIPVLKLTDPGYPNQSVYVSASRDAANNLETMMLGEYEEWRDSKIGSTWTIEVVEMDKNEFENLPEFMGF